MVSCLTWLRIAIKQVAIIFTVPLSVGWIIFISVNTADAHTPHDDIYSVAVSPDYNNDNTLLVLTRGAVLKSIDAGKSWYRVVIGLDNRCIPFSIDISATDKKVMYLSTLGDGLYKSEDGGESWALLRDGPDSKKLDLVAVSPYTSDTLFVRDASGRLFGSMDGAASWTEVTPGNSRISAFGFISGAHDEILIGDISGSVHFSDDTGNSWRTLWHSEKNTVVTALAARSSGGFDRQILIGTSNGEVLKSFDGGSTFTTIFKGETDQPVTSVAFSPRYSEDQRVFAVFWDDGIMCSPDDGNTWEQCGEGLTRNRQSKKLGRPSFTSLLASSFYGEDRTLFMAGYNGLFRSTDYGKQWTSVNTLSSTLILGLGVSPNYLHDKTVAITSYLWGAYLTEDAGASWQSINSGVGDYVRKEGLTRLFNIVFSPRFESDGVLFSSTWYRILKSNNVGQHWRQIVPVDSDWWRGTHHGMVITLSPNYNKDGVVYVGTHRGQLLRSQDGGERFALLHEFNTEISALVMPPNYASDGEVFVGVSGGIYKSTDGGSTWLKTADDLCPAISTGTTIKRFADVLSGRLGSETKKWGTQVETEERRACGVRLAISPAYDVDHTTFAGSAGGLFSSSDGGESWTRVSDPMIGRKSFVEGVVLSPNYADDRTLLVSVRGKGLYKSVDGGQSFTAIGQSLLAANHQIANPPCFPIPNSSPLIFSPSYAGDNTIFGYAESSLFRSQNGGETWQRVFSPTPSFSDRAYVYYRYYKRSVVRNIKRLLGNLKLLIGVSFLGAAGFTFVAVRRKLKVRGVPGSKR
jgi:photosystem II stability/assembly factor-like uncharacterized protein